MLFYLYMGCVISDVVPIKALGISFRYTIDGALHKLDYKYYLLWILLYADDVTLWSDDADRVRDVVTALDSSFRSYEKTRTMTGHLVMPGQGSARCPSSSMVVTALKMCRSSQVLWASHQVGWST